MRKPATIILLLAFTACGLLGSQNDRPDIPGKIVFAAGDKAGTSQIYTMNADGSDLKKLTHFSPSGEAADPAWSPDGQRIVFTSFKQGTSIGPALWIMDADGSNQRVLYDAEPDNPHAPPLAGKHPRWSPDGTKIAFDLCINCQISTNYAIYVFNLETNQVTRLTDEPFGYRSRFPTWSPDGSRIAFISNRDYVDADTMRWRKDLYVMDADGSNQQRLTETGNATRPVWSPDGNKIAYEWNIQGNEVFLYNFSSDRTTNIETGLEFVGGGMWSNDGTKLLVRGRKTEEAQPEMRLLNIEDKPPKVLQTIMLDVNRSRDYDWYNDQ